MCFLQIPNQPLLALDPSVVVRVPLVPVRVVDFVDSPGRSVLLLFHG